VLGVADAVTPGPLIAVGGIGDARVAAVFALGAHAAWLVPHFLLAQQMPVHENHRRRVIEAVETEAQWYPDLYEVGWPNAPRRVLRNSTAAEWEAAGRPQLGSRPGEGDVIAHFASCEPIVGTIRGCPGSVPSATSKAFLAVRVWRSPKSDNLRRRSWPNSCPSWSRR
jgi:NAD(P)H-dependent flavin oxidoreductase YrpB (nitropropane dioxygenase family)